MEIILRVVTGIDGENFKKKIIKLCLYGFIQTRPRSKILIVGKILYLNKLLVNSLVPHPSYLVSCLWSVVSRLSYHVPYHLSLVFHLLLLITYFSRFKIPFGLIFCIICPQQMNGQFCIQYSDISKSI